MLAKLFKPMDYSQFKKTVTKAGWRIEPTAKHHAVLDDNNKKLMVFAIHHASGAKRFIKAYYVQQLNELLKEKGN